jgi:ABC-type sugar transport system ATPase subunit
MDKAPIQTVVSIRGLSKRYGGVHALESLDLDIARGQVHAIVGENGAGKSTLMKILAGSIAPDSGSIEVMGNSFPSLTVKEAVSMGIGLMYQDLRLFPNRDVLTNLFPNREISRMGIVDRKAMKKLAIPVLTSLGLSENVDRQVSTLPLWEQQLIELTRVLIEKPKLLILDEPTSALNARESERLINLVKQFTTEGMTVLYVSHRLDEVFEVSNHISVLRNGRLVFSEPTHQLDISRVITGIVGDKSPASIARESFSQQVLMEDEPMLKVKSLRNRNQVHDISFDIQKGEILGVAGLIGSGADELLETIFGTRTLVGGAMELLGKEMRSPNPPTSVKSGMALIPADRKRGGLMLERSVLSNLSHVVVGAIRGGNPLLRKSAMAERAKRLIQKLAINTENIGLRVSSLSGGNQQKVVIAKWLEVKPRLVLLDDPTRGVDIGAKLEIFRLMREMASEGKAILFRSTEISELVSVINDGVGTSIVSNVSEDDLLKLINGGER